MTTLHDAAPFNVRRTATSPTERRNAVPNAVSKAGINANTDAPASNTRNATSRRPAGGTLLRDSTPPTASISDVGTNFWSALK
ncbi:MAG: hypothetical protein QM754_09250 [Tepidisphaeraceae bacterium]